MSWGRRLMKLRKRLPLLFLIMAILSLQIVNIMSSLNKAKKERNTKVIIADNSKITDEYLRKFEYMVFPDNASLALMWLKHSELMKKQHLKGMLNAPPDPGAMRILPLISPSEPGHFVNGFAANDASSTLNIWKRVKKSVADR